MPEYIGKTRRRMAEIRMQQQEKYRRENFGPTVDEVKQRNEAIESQRFESSKARSNNE